MQQHHEPSPSSNSRSPNSNSRRPQAGKRAHSRARKAQGAAADRAEHPAARFLTVTLDADSARVIRIEGQDARGTRVELSNDERASIVRRVGDARLEDLVEEAFEAGIACVLGGNGSADVANETTEDMALRRQLLAPLIERSAVGHWLKRDALDRVILKTLVDHSST